MSLIDGEGIPVVFWFMMMETGIKLKNSLVFDVWKFKLSG
jgi:hypothetical protein